MKYKEYLASVVYDDEARIFHGEVMNTKDVITFQGKSVKELERAFKDSIDDYVEWCKSEGAEPEKPYSGKFNIRISPELHRAVSLASSRRRVSLNSFVEQALKDELLHSA